MGIKLGLLFLFLAVQSSCSQSPEIIKTEETQEERSLSSINYLALGDSYTVGESVDYDESFPAQLSAGLEKDYAFKVNTTVIAQTGWRTDELLSAVDRRENATYAFVTLLIGVNNQFQARAFSQYETEFELLLEKAIIFADNDPNRVVVLSIPDYAFTPFGERNGSPEISIEIDQYNSYAKSVSRNKGAQFLTITDITREGLTDPELVAKDGLHPSGKAYAKFVERLYPLIRSRLKD